MNHLSGIDFVSMKILQILQIGIFHVRKKDHEAKTDGKSDSSSDSDTSSSRSDAEIPESTKPMQFQNDLGSSEEVFVGWTTHIQHAVRVGPSPKQGAPNFEGVAWRSMCGARLG